MAPIVKSEPASHVPAEAQYPQGQGIVADPNMEYGEEYGEYEGYEEGDYDTSMMDPNMAGADGNKGKPLNLLNKVKVQHCCMHLRKIYAPCVC